MLKNAIKALVFAVAVIVVAPLILLAWIEKALTKWEFFYSLSAQLLAIVPGLPGCYLRGAFYFACLEDCSWETHIGFGSLFTHRGARVGRQVSTGAYCVLGHVDLGEQVRIASRVSVPSGKRQHLDEGGRLSEETHYDRVRIGDNCWLGESATIIADVGERSIVSSGAVVVNDMPPDAIIGGNPAKVLKVLESSISTESG